MGFAVMPSVKVYLIYLPRRDELVLFVKTCIGLYMTIRETETLDSIGTRQFFRYNKTRILIGEWGE